MKSVLIIMISVSVLFGQADYREIHKSALVADLHTDVLLQIFRGADISRRLDYTQVDIPRLQEGGVDVQFFAIWPDPGKYGEGKMFDRSIQMIDRLESVIGQNPGTLALAVSPKQINSIVSSGRIAACLGVEGGTALENDLDNLQKLYDRGVRYLGLTWEDSPDWATSAKEEYHEQVEGRKGLSAFGRDVIRKMNQLGMMVDVSHAGEQTFWDVMEVTTRPPIASHSGVYNIRWHYRNLKDEQIVAIAQKGGVVFINFYIVYLDYEFTRKYDQVIESSKAYMDSLRQLFPGDILGFRKVRNAYYRKQTDAYRPDLGRIIDHVDGVINLVGEDHVGLGSDFDGISMTPKGIDDVSMMPELTREMLRRGYSKERIEKVLGANLMRVFAENVNE